MLDDFARLRANPASSESRLIIGPYAHARDLEWPNADLNEPYRQDSVAPALAWFEHRLRGAPLSMSRVRLFVLGENVWRDEDDWPLARTRFTPFYLGEANMLSAAPPRVGEGSSRFAYDPRAPVPTAGGAMLGVRGGVALQQPAGARDDVLSFLTAPLTAPLEITGPLRAVLWVSTDAPSTDFTAKLSFVDESGGAYNLADGIVRRDYQPNQPTRIEIDLGATSMLIAPGYRLRLDISSSNHPRFDRNPNTGESTATATRTVIAQQTIWRSSARPSHIVLPVIPR
jgi:putative CocE/NonD family hydrolase